MADVTLKPARRLAAVVTLDDGSCFFVKQLFPDEMSNKVRSEVDLINLVKARAELAPFRKVMPSVHLYDGHSRMLVTEGLLGYKTLREHGQFRPILETEMLDAISQHLASCHQVSRTYVVRAGDQSVIHLHAPVPTYGHVTPTDLAHAVGREYPNFLRVVQGISPSLRELKESWIPQCLIHGDFKDDNIMVRSVPAGGGIQPDVRFVDWELSGWGDPLWDVGSLVGQILLYWIASIRIGVESSFLSWIREATVPFESVRFSATYFVARYAHFSGVPLVEMEGQQARIVQYAGLFLLHRARANLEVQGVLSTQAYCCLHMGRTLVADPNRAVRLLFVDDLGRSFVP